MKKKKQTWNCFSAIRPIMRVCNKNKKYTPHINIPQSCNLWQGFNVNGKGIQLNHCYNSALIKTGPFLTE